LDVTFKEDSCWVRTGYGPENLSTLRKLALQVVSQQKDKLSLQKRRVKAAYDVNYLKKLFTKYHAFAVYLIREDAYLAQ
jgi:hypothetical protein